MAQYLRRIQNPYMPQGSPDLTNAPTPLYAPGEIGCTFNDPNGATYLRALVDSGATSSTGIGHKPQIGEVAFWKDQTRGIVTNDRNQCDLGTTGATNRIAGVFGIAPTVSPATNGDDGLPLMYAVDLIVRTAPGRPQGVQCSGVPTVGQSGVGNTSANTANTIATAAGTAFPSELVCIFTGAAGVVASSGGTSYAADINIGFQD
jgi:hypothetical protein